jgi:signal transduction histidine kinase
MGYAEETIPGMDVLSFFAPEAQVQAAERIAGVAGAAQSAEPWQAQGIRMDGTRFWAEVYGQPLMLGREEVRVSTIVDITQRRKAEQQQVSLAVETEKVKVLQRVITSVSHDLRTPLSTINTGVYLMSKFKADPVRFDAQVARVEAQVKQLEHLIDDLLTMSRLDRRQTGEYQMAVHPVNALVTAALHEVRPQALGKRQTLDFQPGIGLPELLVDADEFQRMLGHLLRNAVSFTPEGGCVAVSTAAEKGGLVIHITDTGIGISAHDLQYIFDYFYRADTARNTETGGTGLGLTIARRICEAHHGHIEVVSAPGAGSTFSIHLPAAGSVPAPLTAREA